MRNGYTKGLVSYGGNRRIFRPQGDPLSSRVSDCLATALALANSWKSKGARFWRSCTAERGRTVLRKFLDQMSTFMINQSESGISWHEAMRRGGVWPYQRTPQRSKEGRTSSTSFRDGSDFLRTIAPNQHVVKSNASLVESCATVVPFSM
jgi:hypothetical protein